jgi:hypothetical protein
MDLREIWWVGESGFSRLGLGANDHGANPRWFAISTHNVTDFALTSCITFIFLLKGIFFCLVSMSFVKFNHLQTVQE